MQITFNEVSGYETRESAVARGEEVASRLSAYVGAKHAGEVRWCVVSLESGRYAPCFAASIRSHVNPGLVMQIADDVCMMRI